MFTRCLTSEQYSLCISVLLNLIDLLSAVIVMQVNIQSLNRSPLIRAVGEVNAQAWYLKFLCNLVNFGRHAPLVSGCDDKHIIALIYGTLCKLLA